MNKIRVTHAGFGNAEGYVIGSQFRDGRWVYKISFLNPDDPKGQQTYDNWIPEDWLELTK